MYRVREEIDEVVGDKTSVEADDLDKLTYINQVYKIPVFWKKSFCCLDALYRLTSSRADLYMPSL